LSGRSCCPAILEALLENAVLVAQAVTRRREPERRHGIEETRGEPAEAAVAQARVRLDVEQLHPLSATLVEGLADDRIEHQVHDGVGERAADQELDRDVINPLWVCPLVGLVSPDPTVQENVADRPRHRLVALARVGRCGFDDVVELQMPLIERVWRSGKARRAAAVVAQQRFYAR
jgi:hypothetical protein